MIRDYQVDRQLDTWAAPVVGVAEIVPDGRLGWCAATSWRQPSDEALLAALAQDEAWALDALYQRYSRGLYSMVYRMVSNQQVAEDLLQDVFLAVWRCATSYSPQAGSVRGWLFGITHHRTIDYLRRVRCQSTVQHIPLEEVAQDESIASPDTWEEAWRCVKSSHVKAALMQLPSEQRLVIELAYFQGWTHAEIAQGMHIPLGTVKGRMRLGLIHLKQILIRMGMDEM